MQHLRVLFTEHDHNSARVLTSEIKSVEAKVLEVERILNAHSASGNAHPLNEVFVWHISGVHQIIRDAKLGHYSSINSKPFYIGKHGYKMCIRACFNNDGTEEGIRLSIFFVLMRGDYDSLLHWPFESEVTLILVDQDRKKDLVQTFKPNAQSSSFQRPKTDMNVASGCPEFADLSVLDNTSYVKDDVMYIKAIVDTSRILYP